MDAKVPCTECGKLVAADIAAKRSGLCILCSVKLSEKVPCVECGKPVSVKQAAKRNGLCLRCSAQRNPFFVLYASLIERVCHSADGFDGLSGAERLYYTTTLFQNEVNNGGFHQFFFNNSGSYYELLEKSLRDFDEPETLELLHQAKQIIFPDTAVPAEVEKRRELMMQAELSATANDLMSRLEELDKRFYRRPNTLGAKLDGFAREKGLVALENEKQAETRHHHQTQNPSASRRAATPRTSSNRPPCSSWHATMPAAMALVFPQFTKNMRKLQTQRSHHPRRLRPRSVSLPDIPGRARNA